jgi:glycosyltransferase involved in cell wall biosynthesis
MSSKSHDYSACAFTEKVRKFCIMMKDRGHTVFLYAGDQNIAPCDELITCITEEERAKAVGDQHYCQASFDYNLPHWRKFNFNAAEGIRARAEQKDFICVIGGRAHEQIAKALPHMMTVEFGIGYGGTFAKYRIWESYAWMHTVYGAQQPNHNPNDVDGIFFDAVIPGYFEPELFQYQEKKDDYFFYIGRLTARKGFQIAADVCEKLDKRLIIAGQGEPPTYGEYVGVIGPKERNMLMANAAATFVPTTYIEPFGNVAVESMYCGTPVISTDWGAMTETVLHGKTGFRCRTLAEFCDAAKNVGSIDPYTCHVHARDNYSLEVIGKKYEDHFKRLLTLWGNGWYEVPA